MIGLRRLLFLRRTFSNSSALRTSSTSPEIPKRVKDLIDKNISENDLVIFMKGTPGWPKCGFSRLAVQILELNGVEDYKAMDVLEDDELRDGIKKFSQWPTIPQIYIKGELVGGADIMRNLHETGELREMLRKNGIVKDENM